MQIDERTIGDVLILDIKGRITLGEGDELLKDKVNSLLNQGQKKIILNLAEVPYIDSAGLGEIVRTYTTVSRQGGSLLPTNPAPINLARPSRRFCRHRKGNPLPNSRPPSG